MHYEFRIVHDTHVRASLREGWIHQMHGFSQQLRIMNYELIMTRTSVRLYEGWIHQMHGFSQQLCITHYEL